MEQISPRPTFRFGIFPFFTAAALIIRIAAIFLGATALFAQSSDNQEPARLQLIALNAQTNVVYPAPSEPAVSHQPQVTQPAAPLVTSPATVNQPSTVLADLNMSKERTSDGKAWFTAGSAALPAIAKVDPTIGLPLNRYGAAPVAVRFSFGRK
jgi:hypothetical protein